MPVWALAVAFAALVLSHEGGVVLAAAIIVTLVLRGPREPGVARALAAFGAAMAVWGAIRFSLRPGGYIGRVVVTGEADVALQQIPELMAVPGLDVVGPLPAEVQKVFETSIGLVAQSSNAAAAEGLVRFFLDTAHGPLFQSKGLEQAAP